MRLFWQSRLRLPSVSIMDGVYGVEMDPSVVAEGWEKLHDRYYRRTELYKMQWGEKVKLERSTVIGCSCGGAIGSYFASNPFCLPFLQFMSSNITPLNAAVRRNHSKAIDATLFVGAPQIEIYSKAGQLISAFPVRNSPSTCPTPTTKRLRNFLLKIIREFLMLTDEIPCVGPISLFTWDYIVCCYLLQEPPEIAKVGWDEAERLVIIQRYVPLPHHILPDDARSGCSTLSTSILSQSYLQQLLMNQGHTLTHEIQRWSCCALGCVWTGGEQD